MTRGNRGIILITSYLLLSLFLVYSNAVAVRTLHQAQATNQVRGRFQAENLAQASVEQLREGLFQFFTINVFGLGGNLAGQAQNDAEFALSWLDQVDPALGNENPPLDSDNDGLRDGVAAQPRCVLGPGNATGLPTAPSGACNIPANAIGAPRAWVAAVRNSTAEPDLNNNGLCDPNEDLNGDGVCNPVGDPLGARDVTFQGEAVAGGVTRRLQATYRFELNMSDIFRYGYFINNSGWMQSKAGQGFRIYGDVRSNGPFRFTGPKVLLNGDIYASGTITGAPGYSPTWESYWVTRPANVTGGGIPQQPALQLNNPTQPAINGRGPLPAEMGWDSTSPAPDPNANIPQQTMPFLGNLSLYQNLSAVYRNLSTGVGAQLRYKADTTRPGGGPPNGIIDPGDPWVTLTPQNPYDISKGPDQVAGTADDGKPLILHGSSEYPITIDGPLVVPGDVLVKGYLSGRGTIYAGRNLHVVGGLAYANRPSWPNVQRDTQTGTLRQSGISSGVGSNLGTVCTDGTYYAPACDASGVCTTNPAVPAVGCAP